MTITLPSGRSYEWSRPQPMTAVERKQLEDYDKSLDPAPAAKPTAVGGQGSDGWGAVAGTVAEVGLGIVGGLAGSLGGPIGIAGGAAAGSALGNYVNQKFFQNREDISEGQVLASAVLAATPANILVKAAKVAVAAKSFLPLVSLRAAQGAGTSVVAAQVEKAIDEKRLLTGEELVTSAGLGLAVGAGLGGLERRYSTAGALITNNVASELARGAASIGVLAMVYNNEIEKGGDMPFAKAIGAGAVTYGATHLPSLLFKKSREIGSKIAGPEATLGKEMMRIFRKAEYEIAAMERDAFVTGKYIQDELKKMPNRAQVAADIFQVYQGQASSTTLPPSIKEAVDLLLSKRVKNTDHVLDSLKDFFTADELKPIRDGKDSYLRTAYAAHDPNAVRGMDYATPKATSDFHAELLAAGHSKKEANQMMMKMLKDEGEIYGKTSYEATTGPASAWMGKNNLSDKAKAFLGEVKDVAAVTQETLRAQNRLIISVDRDNAIRTLLLKSGVAKKTADMSEADLISGNFVSLVKSEGKTIHEALKGLYVPKVWAEAFQDGISPHLIGDNGWARTFMTVSSASKAAKTVGNVLEAGAPQVLGNLMMAASSLKLSPKEIIHGIRLTMRANGWYGKNLPLKAKMAMDAEITEAQRLGVLQGGADVTELKTLVNQAADIGKKPRKIFDFLSKVYGFPDSAVRFSIWKGEVAELKIMRPGLGEEKWNMMAAENTNNHFPTYDKINRRFRQLSAVGVANTFGAFEYETVRTSTNQVKYAISLINEGLRTGNREMYKIGAKRLLAFSVVAGSTAGVATAISRKNGIDAQTEKDLQNVVMGYNADKANAFKLNSNGTFSYTPLNYLMPYSNMMKGLGEAMSGGKPLSVVKSMYFGNDLGPLITPMVEAINNTYYGTTQKIETPRDDLKLAQRAVIRAFVPQVVSGTAERFLRSQREESNALGHSPTGEDVSLRIAGWRQDTVKTLAAAKSRIGDVARSINDESAGYRQIIKSAERTKRSVNEPLIYAARALRYERKQSELRSIYSSMNRLSERNGFKHDDIIQAFKDAGVPNGLIVATMFGYKVPMTRGIEPTNSEIIREMMADPEASKDPARSIANMANGNRVKQKHLVEAYKSERMSIARGGDSISSLFGGLSVGDGERAHAIMEAAKAIGNEPEKIKDFINHLKKTHVITPEVNYQLKRMGM